MPFRVEMTDTFAGEANYSWVRRGEIPADHTATRRAIVRRIKAWAGLSGVRCRVLDLNDGFRIRPHRQCIVVFATWIDSSEDHDDHIDAGIDSEADRCRG